MTFFTVLFYYFAVTEVYDDSQLILLKPRDYERELAERENVAQSEAGSDDFDRNDNRTEKDSSCLYELLFCGSLRRCMFIKLSFSQRAKKNARRLGVSILTALTLITATTMELCNRKVWAEWLPEFKPHYSEVEMDPDTVNKINVFIWAKTAICSYLIVVALLLRMNRIVALALVSIIGAPVFACIFLANRNEEQLGEGKREAQQVKPIPIQESAKKLNGQDLELQ